MLPIMCYLINLPFLFTWHFILDVYNSSECKVVDQPILLTILTNQIWLLAQWWTRNTWGWPEPYNTDKGQIWFLQTCGSTSLIKKFNISNLTLGTVMNWEHPRVVWTSKHGKRSNLIVLRYQWKTVLAESVILQIIHVVEARGSLDKLTAKAHQYCGENTKKMG